MGARRPGSASLVRLPRMKQPQCLSQHRPCALSNGAWCGAVLASGLLRPRIALAAAKPRSFLAAYGTVIALNCCRVVINQRTAPTADCHLVCDKYTYIHPYAWHISREAYAAHLLEHSPRPAPRPGRRDRRGRPISPAGRVTAKLAVMILAE